MPHRQAGKEYPGLLTGFGHTKAWAAAVLTIKACSHLIRQGGNFIDQLFDFI